MLMPIKYPLLVPTFGHGATSLIINPYETLASNFICGLTIYYCSYIQRKMLLLIFSIYHIANDFNIKNNFYKYSFSTTRSVAASLSRVRAADSAAVTFIFIGMSLFFISIFIIMYAIYK